MIKSLKGATEDMLYQELTEFCRGKEMSEGELIKINLTYAETMTDIIEKLKQLGHTVFLVMVLHDRMLKYFIDKEQKAKNEKKEREKNNK